MIGKYLTSPRAYLQALSEACAEIDPHPIERCVDLFYQTWQDDGTVFVIGNGGSAFTAGHQACDYTKTAAVQGRRPLRAIDLVGNIGLTTAIANDHGYEEIFGFLLRSYARPGDVLVAISVSGNSQNVVRACEWARQDDLRIVGLTGQQGGSLAALSDIHINVPGDNYGLVEDLHLAIGHMVTQALHGRIAAQGSE